MLTSIYFLNIFIYLFLAVLGLLLLYRAFLVSRGYSVVVVLGLLIVVASLVKGHWF